MAHEQLADEQVQIEILNVWFDTFERDFCLFEQAVKDFLIVSIDIEFA